MAGEDDQPDAGTGVHTPFTGSESCGNGGDVRSRAMDRSAPGDAIVTTIETSSGERTRCDLDPLDPPTDERLSSRERAVYQVLVDHRGRVLGRHDIARLAGLAGASERRCDALILGIRRVIGEERIRTVRRRGWILDG